ncbi:hypothetical protein [Maridesulfovibrio sp.]|uniref:hypothetical protein n=1 Tax=Maridesulfovibrio sp. TaxID=2795000 RepID=UPI0029F478E1|nr:hypothetical protein [Maridesulfovibrio sp.]
MQDLLYISICAAIITGAVVCFWSRRNRAHAVPLNDSPSFSRRRRKRAPLDESISVAMSSELKEELVRVSGNEQSKYVRASLRLALPTLKSRPILVDILDEE